MRPKDLTIQERLRKESPYETPNYINLVEAAADRIDDLEKRVSRMPELTEAQAFATLMSCLAVLVMVSPDKAKIAQDGKKAIDELKVHIFKLKEDRDGL